MLACRGDGSGLPAWAVTVDGVASGMEKVGISARLATSTGRRVGEASLVTEASAMDDMRCEDKVRPSPSGCRGGDKALIAEAAAGVMDGLRPNLGTKMLLFDLSSCIVPALLTGVKAALLLLMVVIVVAAAVVETTKGEVTASGCRCEDVPVAEAAVADMAMFATVRVEGEEEVVATVLTALSAAAEGAAAAAAGIAATLTSPGDANDAETTGSTAGVSESV
jgi:hypothetical protein